MTDQRWANRKIKKNAVQDVQYSNTNVVVLRLFQMESLYLISLDFKTAGARLFCGTEFMVLKMQRICLKN